MKILLKKHEGALVPADELSQKLFEGLKGNTWYKGEIKKSRHYPFHCKLFALYNFVIDNSDFYNGWQIGLAVKNLKIRMKFATGHYDIIKVAGLPVHSVKSINFDSMGEIEFQEFYNGCCTAILEDEELGITELGDF